MTHEFDLGASRLIVRGAIGDKIRVSIETPQRREVYWALIPVPQAKLIATAIEEVTR